MKSISQKTLMANKHTEMLSFLNNQKIANQYQNEIPFYIQPNGKN